MAKWLRIFAIFLVFGPFSAMFAEPFFKGALDYLGINTENWAAPMLTALFDLFAAQWFRFAAILAIGIGIGVWLHWFASRYDRKEQENKARAQILENLKRFHRRGNELSVLKIENEDELSAWKNACGLWHNECNKFVYENVSDMDGSKMRFAHVTTPRRYDHKFNNEHNRQINIVQTCVETLEELIDRYSDK